jgi:hypothetical protein
VTGTPPPPADDQGGADGGPDAGPGGGPLADPGDGDSSDDDTVIDLTLSEAEAADEDAEDNEGDGDTGGDAAPEPDAPWPAPRRTLTAWRRDPMLTLEDVEEDERGRALVHTNHRSRLRTVTIQQGGSRRVVTPVLQPAGATVTVGFVSPQTTFYVGLTHG